MSEKITHIEVTNTSTIAAFSPLASFLPITAVNVSRHLSYPANNWVIVGMVVLVLLLFVLMIVVGLKKVNLEMRVDGLHFMNKRVTFDQIQSISYNKRNRYLRVKTRPVMRGFSVYLGKQVDAAPKAAQVEKWARENGLNFQ